MGLEMNVVVFLGAGSSRAFGMPVMAEFNEYARDLQAMPKEQLALTEVIQQARQAHAFLRTHPFNIEDILTMAEMQHRLGLADEQRGAAIKRLIHAVRRSASRMMKAMRLPTSRVSA
jgi:hypothetical protein